MPAQFAAQVYDPQVHVGKCRICIVEAGRSRDVLFEDAYYTRLFVDQSPAEILVKATIHELLERRRKQIRKKAVRGKSRYAWCNVLRATWYEITANKRIRGRLVKNPSVLDERDSDGVLSFVGLAGEMYTFAWDLYVRELRNAEDVRPGQYYFGHEDTASLVVESVRKKYARRLRATLARIVG